MHESILISILALATVALLGYIAQSVGICLVKAVKEASSGSPSLLAAMLMCGLWVWIYSIVAELNHWDSQLTRYSFHYIFALGGFIFGLGSGINQACSVSTMNKLARGNTSMVFTLFGWFLGWCLWEGYLSMSGFQLNYQVHQRLSLGELLICVTPMILLTLGMIIFSKSQRKTWLGIMLVGFLASLLIYIEPNWTPSQLVGDMAQSFLQQNEAMPSAFRASLVLVLLIGMWFSGYLSKGLNLNLPTLYKALRRSIGGALMGIGSAMTLGGNDTQLLVGLPAASIGGLVALIFMILGILVEQFCYKRIVGAASA